MVDKKKLTEADFTDSERQHLRDHAKEREHRRWLLSLIRRWGTWIIGFILGIGPVWEALVKLASFFKDHSK